MKPITEQSECNAAAASIAKEDCTVVNERMCEATSGFTVHCAASKPTNACCRTLDKLSTCLGQFNKCSEGAKKDGFDQLNAACRQLNQVQCLAHHRS